MVHTVRWRRWRRRRRLRPGWRERPGPETRYRPAFRQAASGSSTPLGSLEGRGACRPPHKRDLTGGYADVPSRSHSLVRNASADSQSDTRRQEMITHYNGLSHDGRRDWTNINVGQLPGQVNGLHQTARDVRQRTGQRLKSPGPEAASITHGCAPDPDRPQPARNAPAHRGPFWGVFPFGARFSPRHAPPRQSGFRLRNRNQPLTPSALKIISPQAAGWSMTL